MKYWRHILYVMALILFVASFATIKKDRELASFILAACGTISMFLSLLQKSKEEASADNKRRWEEVIRDLNELIRITMRFVLVGSLSFVVGGVFFTRSIQPNSLYNFLKYNNAVLVANVLYYAIAGAALAITLMLIMYLFLVFIVGGIFLGKYAFGVKNKYLVVVYGALSGIFASAIFLTIVFKSFEGQLVDDCFCQIFFIIVAIIGAAIGLHMKFNDVLKCEYK